MNEKFRNIPSNIPTLTVDFKKGDNIYSLNDHGKFVYILVSGKAICQIDNIDGTYLPICIYEPYNLFGEVEMFYDNQRPTHIEAITNCITYKIDKKAFLDWLKQDFDLSLLVFGQLSEKLITQSIQTVDFTSLLLKDRVLKVIQDYYYNGCIDKLTKDKLCCGAAAPLRSVNRVLNILQKEHKIVYKQKKFNLLKHEEK